MVCFWNDGHAGCIGSVAGCLFEGVLPVCSRTLQIEGGGLLIYSQVKASHLGVQKWCREHGAAGTFYGNGPPCFTGWAVEQVYNDNLMLGKKCPRSLGAFTVTLVRGGEDEGRYEQYEEKTKNFNSSLMVVLASLSLAGYWP